MTPDCAEAKRGLRDIDKTLANPKNIPKGAFEPSKGLAFGGAFGAALQRQRRRLPERHAPDRDPADGPSPKRPTEDPLL